MTYLIIGGLGFIGYNLAKELLKDNNKVIVIDNLSNDSRYPLDYNLTRKIKKSHIIKNDDYFFYKLDISKDNLDNIFKQKIDYAIFLADMAHDYYSILENDYTRLNNGLKRILKYVKKYDIKFILGSSSAVYDKVNKKILNENEKITDNATDYSKAIKVNEDIVLNSNIKALILRIAIPYGYGLLPNTFLYELLSELYSGKRLLGYEYDKDVPKDYIHINDLIYCMSEGVRIKKILV